MSKFTQLNDELHAYVVEHGSRQDEVLARVQEETAAMGSISSMQIALTRVRSWRSSPVRSAHRGARDRHFTGYSAISIARGLVPAGRLLCLELSEESAEIAARNLEAAGSPIASRSSPALPLRRFRSSPSASTSTWSSSTPTRPATPSISRKRSSGLARRLDPARQRAPGRSRARSRPRRRIDQRDRRARTEAVQGRADRYRDARDCRRDHDRSKR